MYFKKIIGYTSSSEVCKNINKGLLDTYTPPTVEGNNYKQWITENDPKVCYFCGLMQGQVYLVSETPFPLPPLHTRCRCSIEKMQAIIAGNATKDGLMFVTYDHYNTFYEIIDKEEIQI